MENFIEPAMASRTKGFARAGYLNILALPNRTDVEERTGVAVLIQRPGTRDVLKFKLYQPEMVASHLVSEKAVRSNLKGHMNSFKSRNPDQLEFGGSMTFKIDDDILQVSVSGLQEDEDVLLATQILAFLTEMSVYEVWNTIVVGIDDVPKAFFDKEHYLYQAANCRDLIK